MEKFGIGQAVTRREDWRLLRGEGRYLDDLEQPDSAHAAVLRSPHAHARITRLDAAAARALPGVLAVYDGTDWQADGLPGVPTRTVVKNLDGTPIVKPERPCLVADRVRFVGDAVAFVVASEAAIALAALELIEVDYQPLPAVVDPVAALAAGAPQVWQQAAANLCVEFSAGDPVAVDQAFAAADRIVSVELVNQRVTAVPMEPRGAIGSYDRTSERFTLTATTQNVHASRGQIAEEVLGIEKEALRVLAADIGGGFGVKNSIYPEYILVLWAARKLGLPVKWVNDRSESFTSDTHGREQHSKVELALDQCGRFLALRVDSVGNAGAYLSTIGPFVATGGSARTQGGPYRIPAIHFHSRVAYTHTAPTDPYRGAGRPEATYAIERVVERAARELGVDPVELRQRNAITRAELPYRTALGLEVDSGDFPQVLERTLILADWNGFDRRAALSRRSGLLRGRALALYLECTGGGPKEFAALTCGIEGGVTLTVGSQSTGMGHETALAQIVSDRLGVPLESIRFVQGDTDATPIGGGHGGSRSLEIGGSAVLTAADGIVEKAKHIAAHQLEAAASDVVFDRDRHCFTIAGTDRRIALADIFQLAHDAARLPPGTEPGLNADAVFERGQISVPNGCHAAEVEIDPDTGRITLVSYAAVDDFGRIVNPLLADGQVMGGIAQGAGQVLQEQIVYGATDGQLLTGSLMDYSLPRADDLPDFEIAYFEDAPTANNLLGVKGAGEAGCVGALPAVVNAALDAMAARGVKHIDMPLTPEKIWRALQPSAPQT